MKVPDHKVALYQKLLLYSRELERLGFATFFLQLTEVTGESWHVTDGPGREPKVEYLGKPSPDKTVLT
jgi:hypothetical protein